MVQERPDYSVIGNVAVTSIPRTATAPAVAVVAVTDAGQALAAAAAGRILILLQNVGVQPVYVRLGAACSAANYHFILGAGAALVDGKGGGLVLDAYTGAITAICAAGLASEVAVAELI